MRTRRSLSVWLLALVICAGLDATVSPTPATGAVTFVVNTTADEDAALTSCSLRKAITAANTNAVIAGCPGFGGRHDVPGPGDHIEFQLGAGTPTINISTTPLPAITEEVVIDGGAGRVELHGPGGPPVSGAHGLTVASGGTATTIRNLVINNFADDGIRIDASNVTVLGCFIGTDATGMTAVFNRGYGIQVVGNAIVIGGATTGGTCTGDCNLISGNVQIGKANILLDLTSIGAQVRGNFIGTNVTGTDRVGSGGPGIIDKGTANVIGGTIGTTPGGACTGVCNLISGNIVGIVIDEAATLSIVQGNFVGTDVSGNQPISNGAYGILSYASGATIGGTTPNARNVVSGNDGGMTVRGVGSVVEGNYLGTNSAGTAVLPSDGLGIVLFQADSATIGGMVAGAANLISGFDDGITLIKSSNALIVGNLIGTAADGITPLPNRNNGIGIYDQSSQNTVGLATPGAGNTIAFNGESGVFVDNFQPLVKGNKIRGNSIYANADSGIELRNGGNDNLAPPTITGIGPLHGTTACVACAVDIYSDSDGQGRIFEGTAQNANGNWVFNGSLSGPHLTATNTDLSNNTSPFSAPFSLVSATPTASPSSSPTRTPIATSTATSSATASATRTATRTATTTRTASRTMSWSATATQTRTRTATSTATASSTTVPSATSIASRTATAMASSSATATATRTATGTASSTPTATPTRTRTASGTPTSSATPLPTATATAARSGTPTASATATATATASATGTAAHTATSTVSVLATPTPTLTLEPTSTATPTLAKPTPTATVAPCVGDCDGNHIVSIDELITGVGIALGERPASACPGLRNSDGRVDIAHLIRAVGEALNGCGAPA